MGVPRTWQPHCQVIEVNGRQIADLWVGGQDPQRSIAEIARAIQLGLGLSLRLEESADLGSLDEFIGDVARLTLFSESGRVRRVEVVERASSAEVLRILFESDVSLKLDHLDRLTSFEGFGKTVRSVLRAPNLERLSWTRPAIEEASVAVGPIRQLELRGMRRCKYIPNLSCPEALEELTVADALSIDLSRVAVAPKLSSIVIYRCRTVENVQSLLALGGLDYFELNEVEDVPEWNALTRLKVREGVIQKSRFLKPGFVQESFRSSGSRWIVPSGLNRASDEEES